MSDQETSENVSEKAYLRANARAEIDASSVRPVPVDSINIR